jgi:lipase
VRLHLREWGEPTSPRIVCLHGVTSYGGRFRKLAQERLADYRVLAPDLRGHGLSEWEPPWDLDTHLADLAETVGDEPAVWIGHSFGGRLALELAAREPGRVEKLVLLDPVVYVLPHVGFDLAEQMCDDVAYASHEEAIEARLASGRFLHTPRELIEEDAREHLERGRDGRYRFRVCRSAVITAWSEMAKPPAAYPSVETLVVLGAQSWLVLDEQLAMLRRAEVVTVPGGHTVFWDAFAETADAVGAFLGASS